MNNRDICFKNLEKTTNNFLNNTLDEQDNNIINLLKRLIVIEKETITKERLFNQLKENYLDSDEVTIEFINNLYNYNPITINELLDMYIDEINNEDLSDEEIDDSYSEMINTLSNINIDLVDSFKNKIKM